MKRRISVLLVALLGSVALSATGSPASAATLSCTYGSANNGTQISALCSSGPLTGYRLWVQCPNGSLVMGPARRYGSGVPSVASCATGRPTGFGIHAVDLF